MPPEAWTALAAFVGAVSGLAPLFVNVRQIRVNTERTAIEVAALRQDVAGLHGRLDAVEQSLQHETQQREQVAQQAHADHMQIRQLVQNHDRRLGRIEQQLDLPPMDQES